MHKLTAALVGNPNCGKTTLFNALTGASQAVGNWPGVTVERKTGYVQWNGGRILAVDLPGIYSLSPYSPEERIARSYLEQGQADVIINVVDASHIERNLYLTTQLLELGLPVVVALNMMDVVQERGEQIDCKALSKALGIPIIPISASQGRGITKLTETALLSARGPAAHAIVRIPPNQKDPEAAQAAARYDAVEQIVARCVGRPVRTGPSVSERIDAVLTHQLAAIPLFFLILLSVFFLTFGPPGTFLGDCMDFVVGSLTSMVQSAFQEEGVALWVISLVTDGILAGVGAVLRFLPQILILFLCLSALEDSGYMARAAFLLDAPMRRLGLSGRAFVPLLLGFGCTVPAVMGTRILEREKDKRLTILITPFFSCSAKMPVYVLMIGIFFPDHRTAALLALYLLGVLLAVLSAFFLKKTVLHGDPAAFVMELPDYRVPTPKTLWLHAWQRIKDFLLKAGSVILLASVLIWFLQSFSPSLLPVRDSSKSILACLGRTLAPLFTWCGFANWQAAVALVAGLAAKESVAGTLGVLSGGNLSGISSLFTPLSAFSFLLFVLLYPPCVAALSAIHRETGSLKWTLACIVWQFAAAFYVSSLFYQCGLLLQHFL